MIESTTHQTADLNAALDALLDAPGTPGSRSLQRPIPPGNRAARQGLKGRIFGKLRHGVARFPVLQRPARIMWAVLDGWHFRVNTNARIEALEQALREQAQNEAIYREHLEAEHRHEMLKLRLEVNRAALRARNAERALAQQHTGKDEQA